MEISNILEYILKHGRFLQFMVDVAVSVWVKLTILQFVWMEASYLSINPRSQLFNLFAQNLFYILTWFKEAE
jgi:hypothetical protein